MRSILRFIVVHFLLTASVTSVHGQSLITKDSTTLYFGRTMIQYGSIVTNELPLKVLSQSHPVMLEQGFSFMNNTQRAWNTCRCYSKTGAALSYVDFNNRENLGSAISLSVFTEPVLHYSPTFQVSLRGSVGLSYLNKVYDEQSNPDNLFYSRPVSYLLSMGANVSYQLSDVFDVTMTARFNHISNGGSRKPNYGINFPMVGLGVGYKINNEKLVMRIGTTQHHYPLKLITHALAGRHLLNDSRLIVAGLNAGLIKQLTRVNGIGVGGDIAYDAGNRLLSEPRNAFGAAVSLQHYIFFGRLLMSQQLAFDLSSTAKQDKRIYQLYTLEMRVARDWYGGVALKAYGAESEYMTFSVGKVFVFR